MVVVVGFVVVVVGFVVVVVAALLFRVRVTVIVEGGKFLLQKACAGA